MNVRRLFAGLLLALLALALTATPAPAADHAGQGYVFFAPGVHTFPHGSTATVHLGGGGEGFLHEGFAAGGELGYLAPWSDFDGGLGVFSLDGSYHFARAEKLAPFATAGYSLFFRSGHANLFNYGFGVNYWFRENRGLRLEFRDHVDSSNHFLDFRIGFAFR